MIRATFIGLLSLVVTLASIVPTVTQAPAPTVVQSPCTAAEQRAALANLSLAAEQLKSAIVIEQRKELEQEVARQRTQIAELAQRLDSEQKESVALTGRIEQRELEKTALAESLTAITAERDSLALKIRRANGRFFCEAFHIGCIGER